MKILLVNPLRENELLGKNPSIIEKHRGFSPPLGLLYLASALRKFTDYQVEVFDAQPNKLTYPQLEESLKRKSYDLIGISAMTFTLIDVYKTVELIKKITPKTKVILGGPHVHLFPEETINLEGVDFAFMGEADYSLVDFLKVLSDASSYKKISGLIYKNSEGKIIKNTLSPIVNLDELPLPKRELLDVTHYSSLLSQGTLSTIIISSRGCPFKCAFCDRPFSPTTSNFRYRSAGNVVDEICECLKLGINDFLFYDDTFTVNKKRVLEICQIILEKKLKIHWDIRTRVDLVDEEILKALKISGCLAVHYGVEAGNDKTLKTIKKAINVEKIKETFKLTKKAGIDTLAYFMIGLPGENIYDLQDTFSLAKELKPDYAHFTIFSPYPGTELYNLGLEKGIFKNDLWREFARNPQEGFKIPLWEEKFSREQLYELIVKLYRNFYLRPSYIFSRIRRIRSKNEITKKAKAALSVLQMRKENVDKL